MGILDFLFGNSKTEELEELNRAAKARLEEIKALSARLRREMVEQYGTWEGYWASRQPWRYGIFVVGNEIGATIPYLQKVEQTQVGRALLTSIKECRKEVVFDTGTTVKWANENYPVLWSGPSRAPPDSDQVCEVNAAVTSRTKQDYLDALTKGEEDRFGRGTGTGKGAPAVVVFSPADFSCEAARTHEHPVDNAVFHELVHAFCGVKGISSEYAGSTHASDLGEDIVLHYEDVRIEEFLAVTLTNMYRSEKGYNHRLRYGYKSHQWISADQAMANFRNQAPRRKALNYYKRKAPALANRLARLASVRFNPFTLFSP